LNDISSRLWCGAIALTLAACSGGAATGNGNTNGTGGAGGDTTPPPPTKPLVMDIDRPGKAKTVAPDPILDVMATQVSSHMKELRAKADKPPYFLGYQVTDRTTTWLRTTQGALVDTGNERRRTLDCEVRVGDHRMDNTHYIRGDQWAIFDRLNAPSWIIPVEDDPEMLQPTLWLAADSVYKSALEQYTKVKGNDALMAESEDQSDDFSKEHPVNYIEQPITIDIDMDYWAKRLREYSAMFKGHPDIHDSAVNLQVDVVTRYLANSDGSTVQVSRAYARLSIAATTRADDGMDLSRWESLDFGSFSNSPDDAVIRAKIQEVIDDVEALRTAPLAEPYVGPAILEGHAAGVYFHEIFGHRVEGHRQKDDEEGQTFAKMIGQEVMPSFIDVYDDPSVQSVNGVDLNGFYQVDDEGVTTRKASLVKDGVLEGFLLSRQPTRGFDKSNGHGRRQEGNNIVARQGNLIVHPSEVTTTDELKKQLIAEIKKQDKPYGLRFSIVQGGFTNTSRYGIQSFKVMPVMVYRVYTDGREELIRGASIDGTPLTSLSQILGAADDVSVFNGYCGAESGFVPVSAVSPSLLVARVEISRAPSGKEKPPILGPPPTDSAGGAK
jgi:predicted Zn-dependent protease